MAKKHDTFIRQNGTPSKASTGKEINMIKATWICISIVLTFIVCWFPYFIHNLLALLDLLPP